MAHIKSAKKRIRQTKKRTIRNKAIQTFYRGQIKSCREAISAGNLEQAQAAFKRVISAIARAHSKGVLPKNTAARYISRLNLQLNQLAEKAKAKSGTA